MARRPSNPLSEHARLLEEEHARIMRELAEAEKTTLISAVTAAQNSPALLQPVLERLQQALGE
jgi:hypothetical protein